MTVPRRRGRPEKPQASYADRGTDGPAMLARSASLEVVEDDTIADDGSTRFTRTEVMRVRDTVIDWYAAKGILHGRRLAAAYALSRLYDAGRNAPTGYRVSGGQGGGEMSDERAEAWAEYLRALDHMPRRCESACMDLARNMWPGGLNAVSNMSEGFAALADLWREPMD